MVGGELATFRMVLHVLSGGAVDNFVGSLLSRGRNFAGVKTCGGYGKRTTFNVSVAIRYFRFLKLLTATTVIKRIYTI